MAVVGAGIGGLVCAAMLAARGVEVVLVERAPAPGGKLREVAVGGLPVDGGPTVFTMRWVFDEIFAAAGDCFAQRVALRPLDVLARHAWNGSGHLDLYADPARSADAIGAFAGAAEARRFLRFCAHARKTYAALERPFLRAPRGGVLALVRRTGFAALPGLWSISPFTTLWRSLGRHFRDPRLRQLFARYATYCGSSPFAAPATLMLVAHVEQDGVWSVAGGMQRLAEAVAALATRHGAVLRFGVAAEQVATDGTRATAVVLASGERIEADAVVVNADVAALARGCLGAAVAGAVPDVADAQRSLSAITWAMSAHAEGFPLSRHNVFFSDDYAAEFADIFEASALPRAPTVYVCAQDRAGDHGAGDAPERLLCLVNAPAVGDRHRFATPEILRCQTNTFANLARCGLALRPLATEVTTPSDFARLFPGTGGALYGPASHGWRASFRRAGSRTRIPRLYVAGGSTHPGPGVPMAALSGRLAAASVLQDLASTAT